MLCWSRFNNIKTADWMFIAGGSLIRLNKKPVPGGRFRDERQKWQKLARLKGWQTALRGPDPLPCLFCPQLFMATQPRRSVIRALRCQVVFVFVVLICPCLLHVWLLLSDTPGVLEELGGSGLYVFKMIYRSSASFELMKVTQTGRNVHIIFVKSEKK